MQFSDRRRPPAFLAGVDVVTNDRAAGRDHPCPVLDEGNVRVGGLLRTLEALDFVTCRRVDQPQDAGLRADGQPTVRPEAQGGGDDAVIGILGTLQALGFRELLAGGGVEGEGAHLDPAADRHRGAVVADGHVADPERHVTGANRCCWVSRSQTVNRPVSGSKFGRHAATT